MSTRSLAAFILGIAAWATPALASETYQYDTIGRLTDVGYQNGSAIHYTYDANGNILSVVTSLGTTGVEGGPATYAFALGPSTPNPASGPTSIAFSTPARGQVTLRVFDVSGRLVATLYDRVLDPGRHVARFTAESWTGGVYFYRLSLAGRTLTGRMVVFR